MSVISVNKLSKSYGKTKVLHDICLEVRENEIFGVIGPDGAGKSTLFQILTTLLLADSGEGEILGLDLVKDYAKIRTQIGYMPGNFSLYMDLNVYENLDFFARLFNTSIEAEYELIKPIYKALEPFKNRRAKALSGGMKQKLALCCALIHKPLLLFLDEPTTGVDAVSRKEFWDILNELKSKMSIVVSTPYMDEASLCDRIALIFEGRFLSVNSPQKLCQSFTHTLYEFKNISVYALEELRKLEFIYSCFLFANSYHIVFKEGFDIKTAIDSNAHLKNATYRVIEASVEDCFMEFLR
ncbi:ATPase [Campylobacter sp. MIT 99-7217]|uniref:ABC transporter ATP-binding protein n=1 Tax=Campylobacter sp. MIT 99-7217 TaxID=535091 RepID=UPI00115AB8B1|nr:ABC transporter ATP-binding protein [Campylobacter sp. MIT 99-7217]TQR31821.1 ATPase [Campylobacter sp. MIT 99-7217]